MLLLALVALGAVLRLIFLDSDPGYYIWYGAAIDEGRWTELAREFVLFGNPDVDGQFSRLHGVLAPGYQLISLAFFSVLGVGFVSARLVSALAGTALIIVAAVCLRPRLSRVGLLIMVLALSIQPELLFLSRIAIPETLAMFLELTAFSILVSGSGSQRRALTAGLVTLAALASKATVAPIVPVLAITAYLRGRSEGPGVGPRRAAAYLVGVLAPALVALFVVPLVLAATLQLNVFSTLAQISNFVILKAAYPAAYSMFFAEYIPALNPLLLPAWCLGGLVIALRVDRSHPAWFVYIGSVVWVVTWLATATVLEYYPERYVHHVLVPLAVNVGAGVTLLQAAGKDGVAAAFGQPGAARGLLLSTWFAVPAALMVAPLGLALADLAGLEAERFRTHLGVVVLLVLAGGPLLRIAGAKATLTLAMTVVSLSFTCVWFLGVHTGWITEGFWQYTPGAVAEKLSVLLLASAFAGVGKYLIGQGRGHLPARGYVLLIVVGWLIQMSPRYTSPRYELVRSAERVAEMVAPDDTVAVAFASSVLLGTELRYREVPFSGRLPDVLVAGFYPLRPSFADNYRLVDEFELAGTWCASCDGIWAPTIRIYRRVEP